MSGTKEVQVVQAEELNLVVNEMTIGTLTSNAKEILNSIKENVKNYSVEKFEGDAKKAAAEKAKFNALAKALNDSRIAYEKKWLAPFNEFKDTVNEAVNLIKGEVSAKLDIIVKAKENEEKEAKRKEIEDIWKVYDFKLVSLDKVFNSKWLNKTYKTKQIHDDIAHLIDHITGDLQSIEEFGEDTATLKELYLSTLDLQATLRRGAELRENRKRLAEEAAKKAEVENLKPAIVTKTTKADLERAGYEEPKTGDMETFAEHYNCLPPQNDNADKKPELNEPVYTFYVTMPVAAIAKSCGIESQPVFMSATKSQLLKFKEALANKGYEYDKLQHGNKLLLNIREKGV